MATRVNERGQDRAARRQLGIRPGMIAYQRVVGDRLEVVFLPAPHRRSLYGTLHQEGEPPLVTDAEQLEDAVMEALTVEPEPPVSDRA